MQRTYLACGAATLIMLCAFGPALDGAAISIDKAAALTGETVCSSSGGFNLAGAPTGYAFVNPTIDVMFQKGSTQIDSPDGNSVKNIGAGTWSNLSQVISPDDTYTAQAWLTYESQDLNTLKIIAKGLQKGSPTTIQVPIPGP
jgi:hypothetical protein